MTFNEAQASFESLFNHELNERKMREFLLSIPLDDLTPVAVIAAAAKVMRNHATPLHVDSTLKDKIMDVVGTGGDKIGSFNISSTVALLCAAAGCYVTKHGNRSITSKSGSADMFEVLGIRLDLDLEASAKLLEDTGFTFMFAVNHHPAMKFIMPVRKSIPEKTIFNILGPLTNPAGARKTMLGVFDPVFVGKIAEALQINSTHSALVVSSAEKMDEISISDITFAARVYDNVVTEFEIDPQNYGLKRANIKDILGGDAGDNAQITINIFDGEASDAQRDIVLINAAAAFVVDGMARDFQEGIEIAKATIESKKATQHLQKIIEVSNKL